jgi:dihydromethanopterin reductase (acceptor)
MTGTDKPSAEARVAWALTGSGHYLTESIDAARTLGAVDLFLTGAAAEVLQMYGIPVESLRREFRVLRDNTESSVPVGLLYEGKYDLLVVAPATSNTVAKMVAGISDTLATNMFAQAGKCRIPAIVFACDTEPVVTTRAPGDWVTLYPRRIDLENARRLAAFEYTTVVTGIAELQHALASATPGTAAR